MRLIDADALAKFIDYGHLNNPNEKLYSENDIREMIDMMPTVDAVEVVSKNETTTEVVRCKDCVYCKRFNDVWYLPKKDELLCTLYVETYHTAENDFCSKGERKGGGDVI